MPLRILKIDESLDALKFNLHHYPKVTYVRFGDNDIYHMVGKNSSGNRLSKPIGHNRTRHTDTLRKQILSSFNISDPQYMIAAGFRWPIEPGMASRQDPFSGSRIPISVRKYVQQLTIIEVFYHPVLFSFLACKRPDDWHSFNTEYIIPRDKIFVGCNDPQSIQLGKFRTWISTPVHNAPSEWKDVSNKLLNSVRPNDMIILGCGQLSRVLAGILWKEDIPVHVIDIGSHIDGYCGKVTRRYLRRHTPCLQQYQSQPSQEEKQP